MGILAMGLFNVISGLVVDKATDLAKEHVESMIDDLLPKDAKKELDKFIKDDPAHTFTNAKDALMGAVEGKLPIMKADGTFKPIEITLNNNNGNIIFLLLIIKNKNPLLKYILVGGRGVLTSFYVQSHLDL